MAEVDKATIDTTASFAKKTMITEMDTVVDEDVEDQDKNMPNVGQMGGKLKSFEEYGS